eukprot:8325000-Pyramimonas_sp.AAC.1
MGEGAGVAYVTPSLTAYRDQNPSFRLYELSRSPLVRPSLMGRIYKCHMGSEHGKLGRMQVTSGVRLWVLVRRMDLLHLRRVCCRKTCTSGSPLLLVCRRWCGEVIGVVRGVVIGVVLCGNVIGVVMCVECVDERLTGNPGAALRW